MSSANSDPTGIDIPATRLYYSHRQISAAESEIQNLESTLSDPRARLENRSEVAKALGRVKHDLEHQSPPDTTPEQRDRLAREEREMLAAIVPDMPSQAEMRRCPPGAIGKHMAFERKHKAAIVRLKNIQRVLNKGNEDPDVANLERYRGTRSTLNMDNAMVPGTDYFIPPATQQYKEGWDRTFGNAPAEPSETQALLARIAELEKRMAAVGPQADVVPGEVVVSLCGKEFKNMTGKMSHERNCPQCQQTNSG